MGLFDMMGEGMYDDAIIICNERGWLESTGMLRRQEQFFIFQFSQIFREFWRENLQSCKRTAKIGYIIHNVYTSIAKRKEGTGI